MNRFLLWLSVMLVVLACVTPGHCQVDPKNVFDHGFATTLNGNPNTCTNGQLWMNLSDGLYYKCNADGSVSLVAGAGGGDVSKSGNPLIHQNAVWVNANTIKGIPNGVTGQVWTAQTGADPIWAAAGAGNSVLSGADTGAADAYTIPVMSVGSCPANYGALPNGTWLIFKPAHANATTSPTIDICGFGVPKNVINNFDNGPIANDILTNSNFMATWDAVGSQWQMVNNANNVGTVRVAAPGTHTQNILTMWSTTLGIPSLKLSTITDNGGVTIGAPTGGAQGAGTLNADGSMYVDGVPVVLTSDVGLAPNATGFVVDNYSAPTDTYTAIAEVGVKCYPFGGSGGRGCDTPSASLNGLDNTTAGQIQGDSGTRVVTIKGGTDAASNSARGGAILRGANETGAGGASSQSGYTFVGGSANSATNAASAAGWTEIAGNSSIGAGTTGLQGLFVMTHSFAQGAAATAWNLQCFTAVAMTVTDCGANPLNIAGVLVNKTSTVQSTVAVAPSEIPINASAAVTVGDTVCAGATAGQVTDSGGTGACPVGTIVGTVIAISGTWPALPDGTAFPALSATLPLVRLRNTPSPIGGLATIPGSGNKLCALHTDAGCTNNVNDDTVTLQYFAQTYTLPPNYLDLGVTARTCWTVRYTSSAGAPTVNAGLTANVAGTPVVLYTTQSAGIGMTSSLSDLRSEFCFDTTGLAAASASSATGTSLAGVPSVAGANANISGNHTAGQPLVPTSSSIVLSFGIFFSANTTGNNWVLESVRGPI